MQRKSSLVAAPAALLRAETRAADVAPARAQIVKESEEALAFFDAGGKVSPLSDSDAVVNRYCMVLAISGRNLFMARKGAGDPGALVNAAGVGILKSSKNKAAAQKLVDFLLSYWAQRNIARGPGNAEYPVVKGVKPRPGLPALGTIKGPEINLGRLGRELPRTLVLLNESGFTR